MIRYPRGSTGNPFRLRRSQPAARTTNTIAIAIDAHRIKIVSGSMEGESMTARMGATGKMPAAKTTISTFEGRNMTPFAQSI
jgi:hypothetical protein